MRRSTPLLVFLPLVLGSGLPLAQAERAAPKIDPQQVINESYGFRRNSEPEMTEQEYALYEKVVAMVRTQPDLAVKLVESLVSASGQQSPAFEFVLGNIYYTNNRSELAEQHYRKAIALHPEFTRAWSNLGAMLYSQGRYSEAADCLVKTIEDGERDAHTLGLLAYCLKKTGRRTAAEMDYIQALGLDPANADYLGGLVEIYHEEHKYAQAEALLGQLIELEPKSRQNWLLYADVLKAQDRPLEAIAILESAHSLGLVGTDGLLVLGDLYEKGGFHREATATFRELRNDSVKLGAERLLAYAESLIASGQLPAAGEAIKAIDFELPPEQQLQLHLVKAEFYAARGEPDRQKEELDAVLAADPLNGRALLAVGKFYKARNETARADLALEAAAQQPAWTYRACVELADLAIKTRRYQRGLDYLQRAAALDQTIPLQPYIDKIKRVIAEK